MTNNAEPEFGKWRSFLWPVHGYELKKVIPMLLMFFCISFNYTILRDTKDTLIVTSEAGAQAIPFLKVWGVVPAAIIFMLIYAKLSNLLSKESLYYVTIAPFLIFFGAFALFVYPNMAALKADGLAGMLGGMLPEGAKGLVESVRYWPYACFYILAELWGSAVLSLLFWGFANDITRVTEAKRFYAMFGIGANIALMVSGPAIVAVSDIRKTAAVGVDAWQISLNYLMTMVVIAGIAIMAVYYWMNRNVLTDPRFYAPGEQVKKKKSKPKMSIGDSLLFLVRSPYILCLTIIVMGYGVAINLVEVTWKSQLKLMYPDPNDYSTFMGYFSFTTGLVTAFMMLFIGGNVLRRLGWRFAALVTPIVLLITGVLFFSFIIYSDALLGYIAVLGTTPLALAVYIGMIQNILSKSSKYSLFDPTKELAYIPLDQESKVKGKAAVDVVGARLGKSGGSLIQQGLFIFIGTQIATLAPYIAGILFFVIAAWVFAVRVLSVKFTALTAGKDEGSSEKPKPAQATT